MNNKPKIGFLIVLTGGALLFSRLVFSSPDHPGVPQIINLTEQINDYQLEAVLAYVKERPQEVYDPETDSYRPEDSDNPNTRDFKVASVDLNMDGIDEVVLQDRRMDWCGSGGCTNYIFQKHDGQWVHIGRFFPGGSFEISEKARNGYVTIYFSGKEKTYECVFLNDESGYAGDCH